MVYKGLEDFGDLDESLEHKHVLTPLAAPSAKQNII